MHYRSKLGPPWFEIQCLLNSSKIIDFNFNEYICVARSFAQLLGFLSVIIPISLYQNGYHRLKKKTNFLKNA